MLGLESDNHHSSKRHLTDTTRFVFKLDMCMYNKSVVAKF